MDADGIRTTKLTELGLPRYAARAYLALLELGTTGAREVRELAHIPPAKVYGTLDQLHKRGLVEVLPGRPRRYAPVPMSDFLARDLEEQRERLESIEAARDELAELFPIRASTVVEVPGHTSSLSGRRNISEQFRRCARDARREIVILIPDRPDRSLRSVARHLSEARARGVTLRILM
ncbi:MAG TPA: helix-turn-helix domain-containing protein, partial [Candidatus Thermoplasmatota archaeon]|nr:helix-turn-helix domain-containing protein [Candidatus Thermoplasmatota archaeon]